MQVKESFSLLEREKEVLKVQIREMDQGRENHRIRSKKLASQNALLKAQAANTQGRYDPFKAA